MSSTIPSLQSILSFYFAKSFWDDYHMSVDLRVIDAENYIARIFEVRMTSYRDMAVCNLNAFAEKEKLPKPVKRSLKQSIFLLHQAYHQLILWKKHYDRYNKIDLLQEGQLYWPNYFTAYGEFNDVAWTKTFVQHSNYPTALRFSLASSYSLQEECGALWAQIENLEDIPVEAGFKFLGFEFRELKMMLEPLKRVFPDKQINEILFMYQFGFMPILFGKAAENGFEHAVYYFWKNMSETEKLNIIMDDSYFDFISRGSDYPRYKVSFFLFSQLSEERKLIFLQWTIQHDQPEVWPNLLLPTFTKVRFEVLELIFQLPIDMLAVVVWLVTHRMKQLKLSHDAKIFHLLWSKLSSNDKHYVLQSHDFLIETMVEAKSLYNLGYIIKCLSFEQKEKCLLEEWYGAGLNIVDILCRSGDFDFLQKYLCFFLFDMDLVNSKQEFRKDAIELLQIFIKSPKFVRWSCNNLFEFQEKEIMARMDVLLRSATLIRELCDKISEEIDVSAI